MITIGHRRHRRRLDAYVDGELDLHATRALSAHLAECWGCSGEMYWRRLIKVSTQRIGEHGARDLATVRRRRWAEGLAR